MEVKFDMTTRQKGILRCLQAAHAYDFLLTISTVHSTKLSVLVHLYNKLIVK